MRVLAALAAASVAHGVAVPVSTAAQLRWQRGEIMALIHFNMATFFRDGDPGCGSDNWNLPNGTGSSNPASFNPVGLNVSQWFDSIEALGATEAVMTAKHGCGFLLWPTNTTLPDGSPFPYHVNASLNVVQMFSDEARARGVGHGFYFSLTNSFFLNAHAFYVQNTTLLPGQANVTQQQYEDISFAQLHELWTQFGELSEIWLDGGYIPSMQAAVSSMIAQYQPNAVAFNGQGVSANPVRWCGTEGGNPPGLPNMWQNVCPSGDAPNASGCPSNSPNATVNPIAVDFTLQEGDHWFWTPGDAIHPLTDLITVYHNSVGANGKLELDFAIDRTGNVHPTHAAAYAAFGGWIRSCYGTALAVAQSVPSQGTPQTIIAALGVPASVDRIMMQEDLAFGQLVSGYTAEVQDATTGAWTQVSSGITIGNKRIDLFPGGAVNAIAVRLNITTAFANPVVTLSVFAAATCAVPQTRVQFVQNGQCLITNSSHFPCAGGAGNSCPLFLGPCSDPSATWNDDGGVLTNVFLGTQTAVNVDCDNCVDTTVAKLLDVASPSPIAFNYAGQLVYTCPSGSTMCLNGGQTKPTPPCNGQEPYLASQVQIYDCSSPTTQGWQRVVVA